MRRGIAGRFAASSAHKVSSLVVMAVLAGAAWLVYAVTGSDAVLGTGLAHTITADTAFALTAAFAVALVGQAILSFAPGFSRDGPTGFQRVVVFAILTFIASFVTLRYFGFQPGTVLTTSAILTAAVGFALQPTLASLFGGLSLDVDRTLRVGDGIMREGQPMWIVAMNWRTTVLRKTDGRLLLFPNAKLADEIVEVLPREKALQGRFEFPAPFSQSPQRLFELVSEMLSDFADVDTALPIEIYPMALESEKNVARYRVQYWTHSYPGTDAMQGEAMRRLWYLYQRNGIALPQPFAWTGLSNIPGWEPGNDERDEISRLPGVDAEYATAQGRMLLFGPDERLIMPGWSEGWQFHILRGTARPVPEFDLARDTAALVETQGEAPGRTASLVHAARALTHVIGPYGEYAVGRAARSARSYDELCRTVAEEIDDPERRAGFLRAVQRPLRAVKGPGSRLTARRNAVGQAVAETGLRAVGEVAILAIPPMDQALRGAASA